ncbi:MAG TPA: BtpA/SgcQ family protein, partial [Chthonomonadales bacterium]|nr:BtpA/SgcQ family protein [Chthonomonadales bacterium]
MSSEGSGGFDAGFWDLRPLVGMVHLRALPGSPRHTGESLDRIVQHALADAAALEAGGASAILVENFFDSPFSKGQVGPHTVAVMTAAVIELRRAAAIPLGVNVLRNDCKSALAIAHTCGARFVRINVFVGAAITDQGVIEGAAREAALYRRELGADVELWADIFVKHASQLGSCSPEDAA